MGFHISEVRRNAFIHDRERSVTKVLYEDDGFPSGGVRDIIESRVMRIDKYKQLSTEGMYANS